MWLALDRATTPPNCPSTTPHCTDEPHRKMVFIYLGSSPVSDQRLGQTKRPLRETLLCLNDAPAETQVKKGLAPTSTSVSRLQAFGDLASRI